MGCWRQVERPQRERSDPGDGGGRLSEVSRELEYPLTRPRQSSPGATHSTGAARHNSFSPTTDPVLALRAITRALERSACPLIASAKLKLLTRTLDRYFQGKPWHFTKGEKKQQIFASASSRAHREWKVSK
eukprot:5420099-Prymnesium_polylepis.1